MIGTVEVPRFVVTAHHNNDQLRWEVVDLCGANEHSTPVVLCTCTTEQYAHQIMHALNAELARVAA